MRSLPTLPLLLTILLLYCGVVAATPAAAGYPGTAQQRRDYDQAHKAQAAHRVAQYRKLRARLEGYPLAPLLDYESLRDQIGDVHAPDIRRYLQENDGLIQAQWLRHRWLTWLAARDRWEDFERDYRAKDGDQDLACLRLAQRVTPAVTPHETTAEIQRLWLEGRRLVPECEALFDRWAVANPPAPALVWERIHKAFERKQLSIVEASLRLLGEDGRLWARRWLAMHRDPAGELNRRDWRADTDIARAVTRHGVMRLARNDPQGADQRWRALKVETTYTREDDAQVYAQIGLGAALNFDPEASDWLSRVPASAETASVRAWRVRAALRGAKWGQVLDAIGRLTAEERQESAWRYWKARALDGLGHGGFGPGALPDNASAARTLYQSLAQTRNYYGFLAADRLDQAYAIRQKVYTPTPELRNRMLARPGIAAALELRALGRNLDARRQWNHLLRGMDRSELEVAGAIARDEHWHDRAIFTLIRADDVYDLDLRFPLLYREQVARSSRQAEIEPSWIYGVMRQESMFVPDARSPAGALGLMQLMPATARLTGRQIGLRVSGRGTILNVDNNVRLGATYLRKMLDHLDGHRALATAAYNAGPHRAQAWRPKGQTLDAEIWVETIPFTETRQYVKNVMAFSEIYAARLEEKPRPLRTRLVPVTSLPERGRDEAPVQGDVVTGKLDAPESADENPLPASDPLGP